MLDALIAQVARAGGKAQRIAPTAFAGVEIGAVQHFDAECLGAKVNALRFDPLNELGDVQLRLINIFDGGGRTGVAADIFNRAAAHAFCGLGH